MQNLDVLEIFAEVSIGLVGFAGVVSALGWSRLHPRIKSFRVQALLLYGIAALAGSLFPLILSRFDLGAHVLWVYSASSLLAIQLGTLIYLSLQLRPLVRAAQLPAPIALGVPTINVSSMLLLVYGLLFAGSALSAIYVVGLSTSLSLGVFHFYMLVVSIQSGDRDEKDA